MFCYHKCEECPEYVQMWCAMCKDKEEEECTK